MSAEPDDDGDVAFLLLTGEKLRAVNEDNALVIRLSRKEAAIVRDVLAAAVEDRDEVTVWVDPIDRAFKIKVAGPLAVWSPPMGTPA